MQNVVLDLIPKSGTAPVDGPAGGGAKPGTVFEAELFRTTLTARLGLAAAAATKARITIVPADTATPEALQRKIGKLLGAGASQADVVGALAAQLASSVAQTLGTPGADARAKLQTLFAMALAPPGRGDPATTPVADRALALAQRFTRLATIADAITGQPSGQQKRIAGNVLDAQRAKDIPAQTTTSDAAQAASTLAQNAIAPAYVPATNLPEVTHVKGSHVAVAARAAQVPHASVATVHAPVSVPAATTRPEFSSPALFAAAADVRLSATTSPQSGDGRRVNIGARTAVAAGGDSGLGRILTRAVLADDARSPAADVRPAATDVQPATTDVRSAATDVPVEDTSIAGKTVGKPAVAVVSHPAPTQTPAAAAELKPEEVRAPAAPAKAPSSAALSAFARSFTAALDAGHAAGAVRPAEHGDPSAAAPTAAHAVDDAVSALAAAPASVERPTVTTATVSAPAPAAIPIDHSAIADQVLRGAFLHTVGKSSEIRLTLVPEALGDVTVKLVVSSGNVSAHVVAETPEVRDALVAAQPQLTKSLAEAGLKLTSFNVDLSGSGFAGFSQQQNASQQNQNRARRANGASVGDDAVDEAPLAAIPSFGPSIAGKPNAGDYNYLV